MKLGLLGGTFDPIHMAHLIIAEQARQELALDQVLFMPCATPPHKDQNSVSSAQHRFQMVQQAIQENRRFQISDLEMRREGKSFTVITVQSLLQDYHLTPPDLFLILGADSLLEIGSWREPEKIFSLCRVVVASRFSYDLRDPLPVFAQNTIHLKTPLIEISSTAVRDRVRLDKSIRYLVPETVERYIRQHGLYKK